MERMIDESSIMTLAAIVAAVVGVVKGLGLPSKYAPLVALAVAALFELVPSGVQDKLITITVIGLTAAGAYSFTKNRGGSSDGKGL